MPEPTQGDIALAAAYSAAPKHIQDFIYSGNLLHFLEQIRSTHDLPIDKMDKLAKEIVMTLVGILEPAELPINLRVEVDLPEELVNPIVEDVNRLIFVPLGQQTRHQPETLPPQAPTPVPHGTQWVNVGAPPVIPTPVPPSYQVPPPPPLPTYQPPIAPVPYQTPPVPSYPIPVPASAPSINMLAQSPAPLPPPPPPTVSVPPPPLYSAPSLPPVPPTSWAPAPLTPPSATPVPYTPSPSRTMSQDMQTASTTPPQPTYAMNPLPTKEAPKTEFVRPYLPTTPTAQQMPPPPPHIPGSDPYREPVE